MHLVFDRYLHESLKSNTRHHRTSGKEVRCKITDQTNLINTTTKTSLSHIDTKQELTVYLAKKAIAKFSEIGMSYIVTYDTMSVTNIDDVAFGIDVHDHEEANTLLILHGIEVSHSLPFCECIIYSPDTGVFLLLVHYYPSLPSATKFKTGKGADIRMIDIGNCYEAIGPLRASSVLGFHTFPGCDQTGKFVENQSQHGGRASWKVAVKLCMH